MRHKAGDRVDARIINTTSHSALFANVGQANYASAKAGVATLTQLAARELSRYGVTANAIAPRANTRMNEHLRDESPELLRLRDPDWVASRSEEHTSELQSLMRISYAAFCLKK